MKSSADADNCAARLQDAEQSASTWRAVTDDPRIAEPQHRHAKRVLWLLEHRIHPLLWAKGRAFADISAAMRYQASSRDEAAYWQFLPQIPWERSVILYESPNVAGGVWENPSW
jgi:hypothetical protein